MYVRKNTKLIKKSISFLKPTNRHIVDYVTHMSVVSKNKSNYIPIRTENSSTLLLILKSNSTKLQKYYCDCSQKRVHYFTFFKKKSRRCKLIRYVSKRD